MIRALAWRSVTSRKLRAFLNGMGIVLGVALVFSVISLSQSFVSTFDDLFDAVYGETDIIVSGENFQGTIDDALLQTVRETGGVETVTTVIGSVMTLVSDGKAGTKQSDQLNTIGLVPEAPDLTGSKVVSGRRIQSGNEIAVDASFAEKNGIEAGRAITVATPTGIRRFDVVGTFQLGGGLDFGGQGFAAIPQDTARETFDLKSGYNELNVKLSPNADLESVRSEIEQAAGSGIDVATPSQKSEDIAEQLQAFTGILYFFAAMALFVGSYLILNSFNMTIAQRMREIGMLRTLGGSRGLIAKMILVEALVLGAIGALFGLLAGLALTALMVALVKSIGFPMGEIQYPPAAFVAAPVIGIGATLVGALRPALRAGRVPPIQAVLNEHRAKPLRYGRRIAFGSAFILLGMAGVFTLASSSSWPTSVVVIGMAGIVLLLTGVIMVGPVIVPALVRLLAWPLRRIWPVEGRLASDSAKANPTRTASTASGLMIGVALVAAIGSLGSSFINSISDDLDRELKNDFTAQPRNFQPGAGPQQTISPRAVADIEALPDVKAATGNRVMWVVGGLEGSDYQAFAYDPRVHLQFTSPEFEGGTTAEIVKQVAAGAVTMPKQLADAKNVEIGDTIRLRGPRGERELRVVGTSESNSYEGSSISMSNATFESLFGQMGFSTIDILATNPDLRQRTAERVDALLAKKYPTYELLSNEEIKERIENQINQSFSIFYAIMLVAILVSLLGVVNTLLMNVLERTREIGVLRAIGSSRWQIRRLVANESLLLTTSGSILGLAVGMALGWAFVRGISAASVDVSFSPPIGVIVAVAVLSVVFGVLASVLPARRAARMNIIEAVSYE